MARSDRLGIERHVDLPSGQLAFRDTGEGPPVVFVHGLLANGDLWREVVPDVARAGLRCLTPDLPLGAHEVPMPTGADLSPPGIARLLDEFLTELDLTDVTLVANDTGGALVQVYMASRPRRVGRVVLTSSDAFERFFPPMFRFLQWTGNVPGGAWLISQALRPRILHRLPFTFGWLTKRPIPADVIASFLEPARHSDGVRRDLAAFLRGVDKRHTLGAARHLYAFDRPVLLAWSEEDRLFPISLAHRLADILPDARIAPLRDAYTFSPLDQPRQLADLIVSFAPATPDTGRRPRSA